MRGKKILPWNSLLDGFCGEKAFLAMIWVKMVVFFRMALFREVLILVISRLSFLGGLRVMTAGAFLPVGAAGFLAGAATVFLTVLGFAFRATFMALGLTTIAGAVVTLVVALMGTLTATLVLVAGLAAGLAGAASVLLVTRVKPSFFAIWVPMAFAVSISLFAMAI